tara:strand:- start:147 stop:392 length:246 start_codon:yes stop_codon:yes gene_type:complete
MFKTKMISVEVQTNLILNLDLAKKSGWSSPYPEKIRIHSLLINEENNPKIIGAVVQTHNLFVIGQRDWQDINMYYSLGSEI